MATTNTMFTHSKTSFDIWSTFIAGELNNLTLQQQTVETGLTQTTCFNMRHKFYKAASRIQRESKLSGLVELDPSYTKQENMPRYSKHRGKGKKIYSKQLPGTSRHKVCVVAAIDEHDNMLFKVSGLGRESDAILEQYKEHFSKNYTIVSDDSHKKAKIHIENEKIESSSLYGHNARADTF